MLWSDYISIGIVSVCGKNPFKAKILDRIYDVPLEGLTVCLSCLFIQMYVLVQGFFFFAQMCRVMDLMSVKTARISTSPGTQTEGNADERFWLCFGLRRLNDSLQGLVLSPNEQLGPRLALQRVLACFELLYGREEDFICLSGGIGGEPLNLTNCWKLQTCTHSCLDALGTSGCDLGTKAPLQRPS